MPLTKLELFRVLTSFSPKRVELRGAPWEELTDWLLAQGLAPLAAYNLEYRLGAMQVPEWVRHRLLSVEGAAVLDALGVLFHHAAFFANARAAGCLDISRRQLYASPTEAMRRHARQALGAAAYPESACSGRAG